MLRSSLILAVACAVCVSAFDNAALIPTLEEAEQSFSQMRHALQGANQTEIGKVYHEVISTEDLLVKMRLQIQGDQESDTNYTMALQANLTRHFEALDQALHAFKGENQAQLNKFQSLSSNFTDVKAQLTTLRGQLEELSKQLTETQSQCTSLKTRHEQRAGAWAADVTTVSKIAGSVLDVECSNLDEFVRNLKLPQAVSLLEIDSSKCPCLGLVQTGSDGMSEGCHCHQTVSDSEIPEITCEQRKENVHELLRALLEQLHSTSADEANTFQKSYSACTADADAQNQKILKFAEDMSGLESQERELAVLVPEAEAENRRIELSINATTDAINAVQARRRETHNEFAKRFEMRNDQMELLNRILSVLNELTRSDYSAIHLMIRESCPHLCSGHGVCDEKGCACESEWMGADCSILVASRVCPFNANSEPCTSANCNGIDYSNLGRYPECSAVVCEYCREHPTGDAGCVYAPTAMFCAQYDRDLNCSRVTCPAAEPVCGLRRVVNPQYVGCCFNPLLDCSDKCSDVVCSTAVPSCPIGSAVRYPLRDCCFNPEVDCVDECAVQHCPDEEPVCPIGKQIRRPFTSCCFDAASDCENECTNVICENDDQLPIDVCRSLGLRWIGGTTDCCFDAKKDCASGDDTDQANERRALEAVFNSTNGLFWTHQTDTKWMTDAWICYWYGVECSGAAGQMHVTSLKLVSNGLSGALPSDLALLSHLTHLDLTDNFIEGAIPRDLARLTSLQSLKLRRNSLSGDVPAELASLEHLEILDLSYNFLGGSIPTAIKTRDNLSFSCTGNCMCHDCGPMRTPDGPYNPGAVACNVMC